MSTLSDAAAVIAANPALAAGVGTVAFGAAVYVARGVPTWCLGAVRRLATVQLDLNSDSGLYREILDLLSRHRVGLFARLYTTDVNGRVVAGYGTSLASWRGTLIVFTREVIEKNLRLDEKMSVTVLSRRIDLLKEIVSASRVPQSDDYVRVYVGRAGYFYAPTRKRKRGLDTIFASGSTVSDVVARVEWFLANEDWYLRRGIPYKLVVLLHGEPGTGKTSLVFALASHFNRSLCTIADAKYLDQALASTPENSFTLVEDVDMLSVSRVEDKDLAPAPASGVAASADPPRATDQEMSALHTLINALDGIGTPHGLVLFMTTNYRSRLDPALIRDGRVDLDQKVPRLDAGAAEKMLEAFYGCRRPLVCYEPITGAELQAVFMSESDPDAAAKRLSRSTHLPVHVRHVRHDVAPAWLWKGIR